MERIAFTMQLDAGRAAEYRARHDRIWPELVELLKAAGIADYSIFLDPDTHVLFAVLRRADDHTMDALPLEPVTRRWWSHMADIMATSPDGQPLTRPLEPVFHLD